METWKGYDAWKTRTPYDYADHHPLCALNEDYKLTPEDEGFELECRCDELRASDKADAAEYRADCRADR